MRHVEFRTPSVGTSAAAVVALATLLGFGQPASAEDFNLIQQKGQVSLGTFLNNSALKIRVDGEAGQGSSIDWGNTFGDKDVTRFRLDGVYRFNERHHLRVLYTDYSRQATRTLDEDIVWRDDVLLAGSSATAKTSFTIIEAAYEYAFKHSENMELAGTFGLHYTTFSASINADLQTPGGGVGGTVGGKASVGAPLPAFGLRGMWRLGHDFYLDAQAQYFALAIDNIDGSLLNYRAAVTWQPKKYFGIGVGYDSFNVDVKVDKEKFSGKMDWTYQGPQAFFNVGF
jgi:long-subunit fatty acid transport protein